jgi:hypothetical protein
MASDNLDDAAFRARLEPLALEVLPRTPAGTVRGKSRRHMLALSGIIATAALGAGAWSYVHGPEIVSLPHAIAPPPPPVALPAPPPAPQPRPQDEMIAAVMARGEAALASHDITAARLLFAHAAALGSAHAATLVGTTYDLNVLLGMGVLGSGADTAQAITWYRRAVGQGDAEAVVRLRRLEGTR